MNSFIKPNLLVNNWVGHLAPTFSLVAGTETADPFLHKSPPLVSDSPSLL